jgi:hypothetical protein
MAGAVLVVGGILVFSINAGQLSYGHELMIAIVVAFCSLFVVSTTQAARIHTRKELVMAEDNFYRLKPIGPDSLIQEHGGFSGAHSPLKTFGELIESMREHG